jgi:hypothetical protein
MYYLFKTRCDSIEDTSYDSKRKGQEGSRIQRFRLNGSVPNQPDLIAFDLDPARVVGMPTTEQMDTWEMDEQWLVVTCEKMNVKRGTTDDGRDYTLISFTVSELHPMSTEERKQLQGARKHVREERKAKRAVDKAAKASSTEKSKRTKAA